MNLWLSRSLSVRRAAFDTILFVVLCKRCWEQGLFPLWHTEPCYCPHYTTRFAFLIRTRQLRNPKPHAINQPCHCCSSTNNHPRVHFVCTLFRRPIKPRESKQCGSSNRCTKCFILFHVSGMCGNSLCPAALTRSSKSAL